MITETHFVFTPIFSFKVKGSELASFSNSRTVTIIDDATGNSVTGRIHIKQEKQLDSNLLTIERIYKFIRHTRLSVRVFEQQCNISNGYFGKMKMCAGNPGVDVVQKICRRYPQLNIEWLLLGKGEMLASLNS